MRVTATEPNNRFGSLCSQGKREPVFVEKAQHEALAAVEVIAGELQGNKKTGSSRVQRPRHPQRGLSRPRNGVGQFD